ncbi:hypothetical protein K457DRAFT_17332 [Linnemannia elongata AG-77]|uniref:Uncharacterized protein n=1 Tax=Linnemannia elongata AG-77 TaxID=1314771 RepID=A0A197K1Z8_9FUNG|nr:hypothetical protein K457DRAFT_17332 [Linnemannia elongata AG-77]
MVTPARLNPPPVFTGNCDGFSALAWLVAVNRWNTSPTTSQEPVADNSPISA